MIVKTYIRKTLDELDTKFKKAALQKDTLLFSKMAILELCGWIEVSMDDLVLRAARRRLSDSANVKLYESMVRKNFGFNYDPHLREMMLRGVGLITVERIERLADQVTLTKLQSELSSLVAVRNSLAHTYITGATAAIDAPSKTKARFPVIYDGLKELERVIWSLT